MMINGYAGKSGLFDPQEDGLDFYESLESMRVQINQLLRLVPLRNIARSLLFADNGKEATVLISRGVLVLRPDDSNPERILIDDAFINMSRYSGGAQFTQPIMDYQL